MKTRTALFVALLLACTAALFVVVAGCSHEQLAATHDAVIAPDGQLTPAADSVVKTVEALPVVGPYATAAISIAGIAFGIWQRSQRKAADASLTEVVGGVAQAFPAKTDYQKT